jgi:predicted Co/Zn/Cd cation transporter (cation efflux family)
MAPICSANGPATAGRTAHATAEVWVPRSVDVAVGRNPDDGAMPGPIPRDRDARALVLSVVASAVFAVGSLAWGLLAGSQMIVFDGLYAFVSVALSLLAVWALRASRAGADERWPWGREVLEPLTVTGKAAALAGLCGYAVIGGAQELAAGGREIDAGWAVAYGVAATAVGVGVSMALRRMARGAGDLVRAEAAEWLGDALLGVGTLAGFVVALVLQRTGLDGPARLVDPAMVVLTSLLYLRVPLRLAGEGLREVLTLSAAPDVRERVGGAVADVERAFGLDGSAVRASKVGPRLDVDVVFLVGPGSRARTVEDFDAVRDALLDALAGIGPAPSLSVGFTARPSLLA